MKKNKITFGTKNFSKNNTPETLATIVNKILIAGAGVAAIGMTIALPPFGIAVGTQIAAYAASSVSILKIVSKMFGHEIVEKKE